jgi:hypothetical protein
MDDKRYEAMGEHTAEPINDRASGTECSPKPRPKDILVTFRCRINPDLWEQEIAHGASEIELLDEVKHRISVNLTMTPVCDDAEVEEVKYSY